MFCRSRKSDSPSRLREGPVTRLSNSCIEKDTKPKTEPNQADVEDEEDDDENSQESDKAENNDNSENDENDVSTKVKLV